MKVGKSALYERLLKEKERQIDILAEQIDYLRVQLALAGQAQQAPMQSVTRTVNDVTMEVKPYVSDEELDFEAMQEFGQLDGMSKEQITEIIEGLGLAPEFDLDNIDLSVQ